MQVQPYLNFNGRCEEALDFYRRALGAEVTTLMRFKDSPDPAMVTPGTEQKVMHSSMRIGDATILASDAQSMPVGQYAEVTIPLYFQGHVYRAGSRIKVTIAAPNGTQPIWSFDETQPPTGTATESIAFSNTSATGSPVCAERACTV